jgi:hypothetical protein
MRVFTGFAGCVAGPANQAQLTGGRGRDTLGFMQKRCLKFLYPKSKYVFLHHSKTTLEQNMTPSTLREMEIAILTVLSKGANQHKSNLIGSRHQRGNLEASLDEAFTLEARQLADRAFDSQKAKSFIRPTYADLANPELWVEITDSGRDAFNRGVMDDLDVALAKISVHLIELRAGAWEAVSSNRSDSLRQAAHSGRELIDQTLKAGASDQIIMSAPGYVRDLTSKTGVTRRHRLKHLMSTAKVSTSESSLKIAEKGCDLVLAVDDRLMAMAHGRDMPLKQDIVDALLAAEIALRAVLL